MVQKGFNERLTRDSREDIMRSPVEGPEEMTGGLVRRSLGRNEETAENSPSPQGPTPQSRLCTVLPANLW